MTEQLVTAFEIVLSEEQLEQLGTFTAIFSQIDMMMFQILSSISKTETHQLRALIDSTTTGQRLGMLRRLTVTMPEGEIRKKAEDVCSGLDALNGKRNHILHGVWGLQWNSENNTLKPACDYERNKGNPIFAKQLPELCKRSADLSLKVGALLNALRPNSPIDLPNLLIMGHERPPPDHTLPKWQKPPSRRSAVTTEAECSSEGSKSFSENSGGSDMWRGSPGPLANEE